MSSAFGATKSVSGNAPRPHERGADALALGVKGKLSNQEMELLKQKLAHAVAYDHVPEDKVADRRARAAAATKPMTRVYHKVADSSDGGRQPQHRPSRKTLASIQYEKRFAEGSYDSLQMRPPTKGITAAAKIVLQDEYVTKPRQISSIPRNLMDEETPETANMSDQGKTGKRIAPAAIPQVFIL